METQQALQEAGYDPMLVREQVADLAGNYGGQALDVSTGVCACLAVLIAQIGLTVLAVDHASSAVRFAQERIAGNPNSNLEVRQADAAQLSFGDNTYRVVTAFDALCHATDANSVVREMFRVCADRGAIVITELNDAGRDITRHLDGGFHNELPATLATHCENCQQLKSAHHVAFVCEKK